MAHPSLPHLQAHHGDFATFRDTMVETSPGRFGPIWWGVWDQLVAAAPDATVVDLGTGPGLLLPMLRARVPQGRIIGVDVQPVMLETAQANAQAAGAELIVTDLAHGVPLPDGVADVVTCVHVIHELEHPPALIAEIARLVRPGGKVVVYDWLKRPLQTYLEGAEPDEDRMQHFREHCLFTMDDLLFLFRRVGLRVVEALLRREGRYALIVLERDGG